MAKQVKKQTIKVNGVNIGSATQPVKFKVMPARACIVAASKGKPKMLIVQDGKSFVANTVPVAGHTPVSAKHPAQAFAAGVAQFWSNGTTKVARKAGAKKASVRKTSVKKTATKKASGKDGDIFAGL